MNHEPECPIGKGYGVLYDHCICYSLRSAYQRGVENKRQGGRGELLWRPSAVAAARGTGTSDNPQPADRRQAMCALCGHERSDHACGTGFVTEAERTLYLCHTNDHDCYTAWTRDGARP